MQKKRNGTERLHHLLYTDVSDSILPSNTISKLKIGKLSIISKIGQMEFE